ncbi:MAG: hypothetical protein Q7J07_07915 [Pelolinea sp.]|nr:hypothetical protein [Pelolinea sp.]
MKRTISPKQEKAIDLILSGMADGETAEQVGAARQTISRWRNQDADFIMALQLRRAQIRDKHMFALSEMVETAIEVVRKALVHGDEATKLKTSLYVLRMSGLQGHAKPGKAPTKEEMEREGFMSALEGALREVNVDKRLGSGKGTPPG